MEKSIRLTEQIFNANEEFAVDGEMELPEYYPEISKILDCRVSLSEDSVSLTNDTVTFAGKARFELMYLSDGNVLTSYTSVQKFTKNMTGKGFEAADYCRCEILPGDLRFKAVAPRRVSLNAVGALRAAVYRCCDRQIRAEEEDARLQCHIFRTPLFQTSALTGVTVTLSERLTLPVSKEQITGFLKTEGEVEIREISCIKNKALIKGAVTLRCDCVDQDGGVHTDLTESFDFSEVKDVFGVDETQKVFAYPDATEIDVDLRSASFSDREVPVTVRLKLFLLCGTEDEAAFTDDVYVPNGTITCKRERLSFPTSAEQLHETVPFSLQADGLDIGVARVESVTADDVVYKVHSRGEKQILIGSMRMIALCRLQDGSRYCVSRKNAFETDLPGRQDDLYFLHVDISSLSAELKDAALTFHGSVTVEGMCVNRVEKEIVVSVDAVEQKDASADRLILYYANGGEDLWSIAKENGAHYNRLSELNPDLPVDLSEPRVLLLN